MEVHVKLPHDKLAGSDSGIIVQYAPRGSNQTDLRWGTHYSDKLLIEDSSRYWYRYKYPDGTYTKASLLSAFICHWITAKE